MVTAPSSWDAFVVAALELRFRALPVPSSTQLVSFIRVVPTIVLKVTEPSLRHTALVATSEVSLVLTTWAVLGHLVRSVPAVVLAVAEQPLWDAPVVGRAWTSSPSCGAVSVPAEMSRLVCVVAAVVVVVAVPQLGDALAVPALELSLVVAGSLVAHVLCLVGAVHAVELAVAKVTGAVCSQVFSPVDKLAGTLTSARHISVDP